MVGIGTGLPGDLPCIIPVQSFLIHQDSHQFCYCQCRMGIIHLEDHLLWKEMQIIMIMLESAQGSLDRCRYEEVLLAETKLLTEDMIIIGIEDFYQILGQVLLLYCLLVGTTIEG